MGESSRHLSGRVSATITTLISGSSQVDILLGIAIYGVVSDQL